MVVKTRAEFPSLILMASSAVGQKTLIEYVAPVCGLIQSPLGYGVDPVDEADAQSCDTPVDRLDRRSSLSRAWGLSHAKGTRNNAFLDVATNMTAMFDSVIK